MTKDDTTVKVSYDTEDQDPVVCIIQCLNKYMTECMYALYTQNNSKFMHRITYACIRR